MQASLKPLPIPEQQPARKPFLPLAWIAGGVVLVAAGLTLWRFLPAGSHQAAPSLHDAASQNAPVPVSLLSVKPGEVPLWLEAPGTVQPELQASITSKVMGRVVRVFVHEGEIVRRGQTLVELDTRDLDAGVAEAAANLRAAGAGYENAQTAARLESSLSAARISEARAKVDRSEAALRTETAKLALVEAGPRPQEREQAALAVSQARSSFALADSNLKRMAVLFREGAISAQQYDQYQSQYEVAKSQLATAQQGKSIADEGSRAEERRMAKQEVLQAQAALQEARTGLQSAEASALQIDMRRQQAEDARARVGQAQAGLELARATREFARISAPFDGIVAGRLADPGVMAGPGVPLLKIQSGDLRLEAVVPESALAAVRQSARLSVHFDALRGREITGWVTEIAPQGDAASHTFLVKVALPRSSGAAAGMFGRARIATGVEKRLSVPAAAVFEREGLNYLYVVDSDGLARLRMVTVGDSSGGRVAVLSGLSPGERIVTAGRQKVTDGAPVTGELR